MVNIENERVKITQLQNEYIEKFVSQIQKGIFKDFNEINFTSETGTDKSRMMAHFIYLIKKTFFV